jgi:DNA-binding HxlR family transcriptional regulator
MKNVAPRPGTPVRGSSTGRPIMAALDLFGRRGTLRILWELRDGAPRTFRALAAAAELPPATVNARVRELREARLLDASDGYRLSALGLALLPAFEPLHTWALAWHRALSRPEE